MALIPWAIPNFGARSSRLLLLCTSTLHIHTNRHKCQRPKCRLPRSVLVNFQAKLYNFTRFLLATCLGESSQRQTCLVRALCGSLIGGVTGLVTNSKNYNLSACALCAHKSTFGQCEKIAGLYFLLFLWSPVQLTKRQESTGKRLLEALEALLVLISVSFQSWDGIVAISRDF